MTGQNLPAFEKRWNSNVNERVLLSSAKVDDIVTPSEGFFSVSFRVLLAIAYFESIETLRCAIVERPKTTVLLSACERRTRFVSRDFGSIRFPICGYACSSVVARGHVLLAHAEI